MTKTAGERLIEERAKIERVIANLLEEQEIADTQTKVAIAAPILSKYRQLDWIDAQMEIINATEKSS